jgi:hypothetical protein
MTFRERQHRLTQLLFVLLALACVPLLMNLLYMGDFTPAGMTFYGAMLAGAGVPAVYLGVQHVRALRLTRRRG